MDGISLSFDFKTNYIEITLAALMSSSARHSAILLMFLNAASRAPVWERRMTRYPEHLSNMHELRG